MAHQRGGRLAAQEVPEGLTVDGAVNYVHTAAMTTQTYPLLVGAALEMALQAYGLGARQSGRTTTLLDAVKAGDVVLCADIAEQRNLRGRLRERGINADVLIVPPSYPDVLERLHRRNVGVSVHLHHDWVNKFYEQELLGARRHLGAILDALKPEPATPPKEFKL